MGRGTIISHAGNGQYDVRLVYAYRDRINQRLAAYTVQISELESQIATIDAQISAETDDVKKAKLVQDRAILILQKASIEKLYEYYSTKMPADPTVRAWCADLTEDMTYGTSVGTIEIPGEPSTVLIRPAYNNRAVYSGSRDGQLMPAVAGSPHQVLFNWMLLPGWQRHKPIYRAGTITPDSINYETNTCSVCLDAAYSSQQSLPAIDGAAISDCNMGSDSQSSYLTSAGNDFCSRNPGHPFCTQSAGSEIYLTDAQLLQLRAVNMSVNSSYGRQSDQSGFRIGDRWDVMEEGGSGDCEDFALTKMLQLVNTHGWNPDNLKLVTAYTSGGDYHAMLGVRTSNRGLVVLDVNYPEVMESGRVPYRIDKISMNLGNWINYARRIDNVPIEYMTCNAMAFADSDRVVVEFTGQQWTSPKVIGFLENPEPCACDAWNLGNNGTGDNDYSHWKYTYNTDSWSRYGEIPGWTDPSDFTKRNEMFACGSNLDFRLFCEENGGDGDYNYDENYPENFWYGGARSDRYYGGAWQVLQEMPIVKTTGGSFSISGKDYCVGGQRTHSWAVYSPFQIYFTVNAYNTNLAYDIASNSWAYKQQLNREMMVHSFSIGGIGYCFGGIYGYQDTDPITAPHRYWIMESTTQTSAYNPSNDTWTGKQSMIRKRYNGGTSVIDGIGHIFAASVTPDSVIEGDTPIYDYYDPGNPVLIRGFTTLIEKYNANSDTWSSGERRFLSQKLDFDPPYETPYNWSSSNFSIGSGEAVGFCERWTSYSSITEAITSKSNLFSLQGRNSDPTRHAILMA